MRLARRRFTGWLTAGALGARLSAAAAAQPLRMIVGFAPGGTVDVIARALADAMRHSDYTVVVDNKPGASGRIGTEALMAAAPDGATLMVTPSTNLTLFPHVQQALRYGLPDFAPVGIAAEVQFGLAVGSNGPKTLADYLERAKADPLQASYGTPGAGSVMHLLGSLLARRAGLALSNVPYKGGAAALNDVVSGTLPAAITALPNLMPMHKAGKLRILAVSAEQAVPALPEVPTFRSLGFGDLTATEYICVVARSGVPPATLARLVAAVSAAASAAETQAVMQRVGFQASPAATPATVAQRLQADAARWQVAVRDTGFKAAD